MISQPVHKCAALLNQVIKASPNTEIFDSFPKTSEISIILSFGVQRKRCEGQVCETDFSDRSLRANIMRILLNQFDHKPVFLWTRLPLFGRPQMCSWGFRRACISPEKSDGLRGCKSPSQE